MTRTPADIINAILANLRMAVDAEQAMGNDTYEVLVERHRYSRAGAFKEAIQLIRTEASSILEAK